METELQLIESMQKDTRWLRDNIDRLRVSHKGQYIAVKGQRIIEANADLRKLLASLKKRGIDPSFILVEFVPAKPIKLIFRRK